MAEAREAARKLARDGEATIAELAKLAGVSRQTCRYWLGGLSVPQRRQAHLRKIWREAIEAQRMSR